LSLAEVLERTALWILANCDPTWSCAETIEWLGAPVRQLRVALPEILPAEQLSDLRARQSQREMDGLSAALGEQLATLEGMDELLPVARLVRLTGMEARTVGRVYFEVGEEVGYRWLRDRLARLPGRDAWTQRAAKTMRLELEHAVTDMAADLLTDLKPQTEDAETPADSDIDRAIALFRDRSVADLAWIRHVLEDVRVLEKPTLAALMVAVHAIRRGGGEGRT
jgi:glutamate dehydrogenase